MRANSKLAVSVAALGMVTSAVVLGWSLLDQRADLRIKLADLEGTIVTLRSELQSSAHNDRALPARLPLSARMQPIRAGQPGDSANCETPREAPIPEQHASAGADTGSAGLPAINTDGRADASSEPSPQEAVWEQADGSALVLGMDATAVVEDPGVEELMVEQALDRVLADFDAVVELDTVEREAVRDALSQGDYSDDTATLSAELEEILGAERMGEFVAEKTREEKIRAKHDQEIEFLEFSREIGLSPEQLATTRALLSSNKLIFSDTTRAEDAEFSWGQDAPAELEPLSLENVEAQVERRLDSLDGVLQGFDSTRPSALQRQRLDSWVERVRTELEARLDDCQFADRECGGDSM